MYEIRTEATGRQFHVDPKVDRIPEFNSVAGDHLWIMIAMYKCDPSTFKSGEEYYLDHENYLTTSGPGCYYCEEPYSTRTNMRRCKGHP